MAQSFDLTSDDIERIRSLAQRGWTDSAIAAELSVSRQTVHYHRNRMGIASQNNLAVHGAMVPWRLRGEDGRHKMARLLRDLSRIEQDLDPVTYRGPSLGEFVQFILDHDLVVDYDANSYQGPRGTGFRLVDRDPVSDTERDIVRRPKRKSQITDSNRPEVGIDGHPLSDKVLSRLGINQT